MYLRELQDFLLLLFLSSLWWAVKPFACLLILHWEYQGRPGHLDVSRREIEKSNSPMNSWTFLFFFFFPFSLKKMLLWFNTTVFAFVIFSVTHPREIPENLQNGKWVKAPCPPVLVEQGAAHVKTRINATLVWNMPGLHPLKVGLLLSVMPDLLGLSHSDLANYHHLP